MTMDITKRTHLKRFNGNCKQTVSQHRCIFIENPAYQMNTSGYYWPVNVNAFEDSRFDATGSQHMSVASNNVTLMNKSAGKNGTDMVHHRSVAQRGANLVNAPPTFSENRGAVPKRHVDGQTNKPSAPPPQPTIFRPAQIRFAGPMAGNLLFSRMAAPSSHQIFAPRTVVAQDHGMYDILQQMMQQNMKLTQQLMQRGNSHKKKFHVMPDFSKTIKHFYGENGSLEAKLWLEQIEAAACANSWPDAFILQTLKGHLDGGART